MLNGAISDDLRDAVLEVKAVGIAAGLEMLTGRRPVVSYFVDENGRRRARLYWDESDREYVSQVLDDRVAAMVERRPVVSSEDGQIIIDWQQIVAPVVARRTVPYALAIGLGLFAAGYLAAKVIR